MREEITEALWLSKDVRVEAWILLDWAKAYRMIGQYIVELQELRRRCTVMSSSHALSQVNKVLASLDRDGYGDVRAVKDFWEEIREEAKQWNGIRRRVGCKPEGVNLFSRLDKKQTLPACLMWSGGSRTHLIADHLIRLDTYNQT